jgi:Calpain family cysteine protease
LRWEKDCLTQLACRDGEPESSAIPEGVKRVGDIFEDPKFFVEGASANDVRQGSDGDCWFLAALATLANKPDLIERICVARDEKVGVYGFVFHRDGEWVSEIIDDKLYLIKPDYDASWLERMMLDGHRRINSEEEYKKLYQV